MPLDFQEPVATPRFVLRPAAPRDLPDLLEVNGDPEVTHFLPYATWRGLDDAQAWLTRMDALAATGTGRQLVVERRDDAKVVGSVLVFKFDEGSARLELGYVIGRSNWRQGVAREALEALCQHAFTRQSIRRLEAEVHPSNLASHRVLLSLGFRQEGLMRQRWVAKGVVYDTCFYGCLGDEWLASRPAPTAPDRGPAGSTGH